MWQDSCEEILSYQIKGIPGGKKPLFQLVGLQAKLIMLIKKKNGIK